MCRADMLEKMHREQDAGRYIFYGKDIDSLSDEEVKTAYMNMMNYQSDARTHSDW